MFKNKYLKYKTKLFELRQGGGGEPHTEEEKLQLALALSQSDQAVPQAAPQAAPQSDPIDRDLDLALGLSASLKSYEIEKQIKKDNKLALELFTDETQALETTSTEGKKITLKDVYQTTFLKDESKIRNAENLNLLSGIIRSLGGERIVFNAGGGDCLFHTVGYHLGIDHTELRQLAVRLISDNWERYSAFLQYHNGTELVAYSDVNDFTERMGRQGTWGDHVVLQVLCEYFHINALIIVVEGTELRDQILINVGSPSTFLIKFNREFHYEAVSSA
jgi:hypothetical protein